MSFSRSATRTRSSTSWRLMVRRFVQVPRERNFDFLGPPRGVGEGLRDVLSLQVGILAEDLVASASCGNEADDRANGDTHAADARLSTHYGGVTSDAGQLRHVIGPSEAQPIVGELADLANQTVRTHRSPFGHRPIRSTSGARQTRTSPAN